MIEILKTAVFAEWFGKLRDRQAKIDYLAVGGVGKTKRLTSTVSEIRIDHGPGYRVYFTQRGAARSSSFCCAAETSAPRMRISSALGTLQWH